MKKKILDYFQSLNCINVFVVWLLIFPLIFAEV